jgi:hypothetical protein
MGWSRTPRRARGFPEAVAGRFFFVAMSRV